MLLILAAGEASRFGRLKQLEPVGPRGEALLDYTIRDSLALSVTGIVLIIRKENRDRFARHLERIHGSGIGFAFEYQDVDTSRAKPWGTGHAVLQAATAISSPFISVNADDYYGPEALAGLVNWIGSLEDARAPAAALVGYRLHDTLSPSGGVSRGICRVTSNGELEEIIEATEIVRSRGTISGQALDGSALTLTGSETVSMNCWAFTPAVFPLLNRRFETFIAESGSDRDAEFLLSSVVNDMVATGELDVSVIAGGRGWCGMTYEKDMDLVRRRFAENT